MEWKTDSLEQFKNATQEIVRQVFNSYVENHALVITLSGDLGAGKTTMTQYIAELIGVTETVQSPTFVIKKQYTIQYKNFTELIHIDAYRLEDENKIDIFQFENDIANPNNIVIIEWSEFIAQVLPSEVCKITIESLSENERRIFLQ